MNLNLRPSILIHQNVLNGLNNDNEVPNMNLLSKVNNFIDKMSNFGYLTILINNSPIDVRFIERIPVVVNENIQFDLRINLNDYNQQWHNNVFTIKIHALLEIAREHQIDLDNTFLICNNLDTIIAGSTVGCRTILINEEIEKTEYAGFEVADITIQNFTEAISFICKSINDTKILSHKFQSTISNNILIHQQNIINHYKIEASVYDTLYSRQLDKICDSITWKYIQPYIPKNGKIIDIAGGSGNWTFKMESFGEEFYIVDISEEMLVEAHKKLKKKNKNFNKIKIIKADAASLPFNDDLFSFGISEGDLLSYCFNPSDVLTEISRVLINGSYFIFGVESLLYRVFLAFKNKCPINQIRDIIKTGIV